MRRRNRRAAQPPIQEQRPAASQDGFISQIGGITIPQSLREETPSDLTPEQKARKRASDAAKMRVLEQAHQDMMRQMGGRWS